MPTGTGNRLLDALPIDTCERILKSAKLQELPIRTPLFARDEEPTHTYFPTRGLASLVYTSERGNTIELATVADEGCVGWMSLLGNLPSNADAMMQVAGAGFRVSMATLRREFHEDPQLRSCMLEYTQYQNLVAFQLVACNRLHMAEARFSRWLLMVQDKLHSDVLPMTQEFLSHMLGTRRTTVAEVVGDLQRAGILESRRGALHIVDRAALENRACECYGIIRRQTQSLYR